MNTDELISQVEQNTPGPDNGVIDTPQEVDYLTKTLNSYKDFKSSDAYNDWYNGSRMGDTIRGLRYPERAYAARQEFDRMLNQWNSDEYAGNDTSRRSNLGQFYTPPELASQMVEMTLNGRSDEEVEQILRNESVLDPTAGSGNLSAAEIAYGFDPRHIYANELDPSVLNDRLIPRLTGLGVPRSNIRPWPNEYRYYGRFDDPDDVKQERANKLYEDYKSKLPDYNTMIKEARKALKADPDNKELKKNLEDLQNKKKEVKSLKDFVDNYGAGNVLNPAANFLEMENLDKDLINEMLKAEEEGDTDRADEIYRALYSGDKTELNKKIEEAIEKGEGLIANDNELDKPIIEEAEELTDNNPHNDEVNNEVVDDYTTELAERNDDYTTELEGRDDLYVSNLNENMMDLGWTLDEIQDNRKIISDFMKEYKDYIYKSNGELANWPLQRNERDYIRNRIDDALPIFDIMAITASQAQNEEGFWGNIQGTQTLTCLAADLCEYYGIAWDNGRLLKSPYEDIPEHSKLTYEDIENLDREEKQMLMEILLNEGAQEVASLMGELPYLIDDWKYEWATKNGYTGSFDEFVQSFNTKKSEPATEPGTFMTKGIEDKTLEVNPLEEEVVNWGEERREAASRGAEEVKKENPITQEALNAAKEEVSKVVDDLFTIDRKAYAKSIAEGGIEEDDLSTFHSEPTREELDEYNKAIKEEWKKKSKEEKKEAVDKINKLLSGLPQMYYTYGETATDKPGFKYDSPAVNAPILNEWEPYWEPLQIEDNRRAEFIPPTDDEFSWIIEDITPIMEAIEEDGEPFHIRLPKFKVSKWNDIEKKPADDSYKQMSDIQFGKRGSGFGSFNRGLHGISGPGSRISSHVGKYTGPADKQEVRNNGDYGEVADDITALRDSDEPIKGVSTNNLSQFKEEKKPIAGLSAAYGKGVSKSKSFAVRRNKLPNGNDHSRMSGSGRVVKKPNVTNVGIKQRIISASRVWPRHAKQIQGFLVKVVGDRVYIGPYTLDTFANKYPDLLRDIISQL